MPTTAETPEERAVDRVAVAIRMWRERRRRRHRHDRGEVRAVARRECWIMVIKFHRLTTEYVVIEDRIRITGESRDAEPVVIWLTHRPATRAVAQLLRWLETRAAPTIGSSSAPPASPLVKRELQSFPQAAAVARLKRQASVVAQASAPSWIVKAVDITTTQSGLSMTFRGEEDQSAGLRFDTAGVRQWLSILHRAWSKAQWPAVVWPDWIEPDQSAPQDVVRH